MNSTLSSFEARKCSHLRMTALGFPILFSNSPRAESASFAQTTARTCAIAPVVVTARGRPKLLHRFALKEGARNAGCASASAASCAKCRKHTSVVATVTPFASGVPHAVGLRLASCSPRWTMLRHRVPAEGFRLRSKAALCWTNASFGRQDHTTWAGADAQSCGVCPLRTSAHSVVRPRLR